MRRIFLAAALIALAGCGDKKQTADNPKAPVLGRPAQAEEAARDLGFPGFATKNTTRVGGADPVADAAGVAQAVYPGAADDSRPGVVTIVDAADFQGAISAAQLMAAPLRSPVLYSQDGKLPEASEDALKALRPKGAEEAGKAQVIRIGDGAATPEDLRSTDIEGEKDAAVAKAIDRLATAAAGEQSQAVIVAAGDEPAYAMPAAGLAAKTGAPVLWVDGDNVPGATKDAIKARKRPRIYVVGPEKVVSEKAFKALEKLGPADRIEGKDPVENAIAVARYSDGAFGWNVVDPGHGLVFAAENRAGEAAAAVALSGTGKYGPLLLLDDPDSLPKAVEQYLLDIQPGYDKDPVRGVYNHAWLLGDEDAISVAVQARIDSLLEIQPVRG
jgi:predicted small lipoprotein YifL